eukprot:TRINITY_DN144_c0_g3_i1.p1 TRINITY_DN144_c0_g3~~TRINITY_DN144_c0_g3_i1.p1  ORF type:complete len:388 (+),score=165.75 TRINITY_DN144_c0_g3_i1:83-1165(+)
MPPKKVEHKVVEETENEPEKPCGFSSVAYIAELLQKFSPPGDLEGAARGIAEAPEVGVPDFRVNLRSSVLVDFWFDNLAFAQQRRWTPEKAQIFLLLMEDLRQMVVRSVDGVAEAKLALKRALLKLQAESRVLLEARRKAKAQPKVDEHKDPEPASAPPAKPAAKPGGKKGAPQPPPQQEAPAEKPAPPQVWTTDDLAAAAEHAQRSLLQHHLLYHRVFNTQRSGAATARLTVRIEHPAQPQALSSAEGPHPCGPGAPSKSRRAVELEEAEAGRVNALRAAEQRAREAEAARVAAIEAEKERRRRLEEEERANQITLADPEKQQAVEAVRDHVHKSLKTRQERLRQRIAALEERLAAEAA